MSSPSLVPTIDQTVYLVLADFGKLGSAFVEADPRRNSRDELVKDFISGQYDEPLQVVAFNTVEGWSRDASLEIAGEVATVARTKQRPTRSGCRYLP